MLVPAQQSAFQSVRITAFAAEPPPRKASPQSGQATASAGSISAATAVANASRRQGFGAMRQV